eukprot:CAMPEP_0176022886 /NCGR_PEP_ID=MMETSP0120_2-20121206/11152_1 /TAXON_ID=160619 /ORGANISM="Kryptoperidinium foliaceum, Strain CCMP 1326" /LENGTH=453 /DNA_ID=CAMNT_0017356037 /DNA_START=107 /DNA_END=1468 /DNA_ORIENTATION=-
MRRGTKLDDPVTVEQVPNLEASQREIEEYLHEHQAYEVFDYLLKELMLKQPTDPLEHMLKCLRTEFPTGPLKVIVASPPGMGRAALAKRLAETFGLLYISAGDLLAEAGIHTEGSGLADEQTVVDLVLGRLRQATKNMQGWLLDGFPRTRFQTSFLKEESMVPAHVLLLKADEQWIRDRNASIREGEIEGKFISPEALEKKLRLHSCHTMAALEVYQEQLFVIDTKDGEDRVFSEMAGRIRILPRSLGPHPPPRVILLGPRGVGLQEHGGRLAERCGVVLVDAALVAKEGDAPEDDPLGGIGLRLRREDCAKQGWVLIANTMEDAQVQALQEDPCLVPTRVVALMASEETCVQRLRHILHDPVTGEVWTTLPKSDALRKRLVRKPQDQMSVVQEAHRAFRRSADVVMQAFNSAGRGARCLEIHADGPPLKVFNDLVDFVERPLALPAPDALAA